MNRKGQGMGGGGKMKLLSILFALVLIVVGGIPLLNLTGVVKLTLPAFPALILDIVIFIGGILLLIDALKMQSY